MWDTTYIAYGVRDTNFTVSTSTQTSIEAHGNHDFSMEVLVSDPDEDPFVVSLSPEDEAKLQTYGLELVEDADNNYKVQSAVGGVKYYNENPLSISFSLNADDNKALGSVVYSHSLTLHPNYDPEIDVVDAKPGVGSAADTIIFFWNDDPSAPVHNEAIINLMDANGDTVYLDKTADLPEKMSLVENDLVLNSYKLLFTSTGAEGEGSGSFELLLKAFDDFGGQTEKTYIIKVVSKYYKNKVVPFEKDQFGGVVDGDKVELYINDERQYYKANVSKVVLPVEPNNPQFNTPWNKEDSEYSIFSFLTTYGDLVKIRGAENVGTLSGDRIRVAWRITENEGHAPIENFPNPKTKSYYFVGDTEEYNIKYYDQLPEPKDWGKIYPLSVGAFVRIKTAGDARDY